MRLLTVRWKEIFPRSGYEKMMPDESWVSISREEIDAHLDAGLVVRWAAR